jgi:hypothetical protein
MTHTPGPWQVIQTVLDDASWAILTADQTLIAVTDVEANAKLIAAAPELLKMCQIALAAWEGSGPPIVLDELRAAINKARVQS